MLPFRNVNPARNGWVLLRLGLHNLNKPTLGFSYLKSVGSLSATSCSAIALAVDNFCHLAMTFSVVVPLKLTDLVGLADRN